MPQLAPSRLAPIATDADGVVRVGGTRVTLDTVVEAFNEGMTAEGIAEQYPSLRLADVYSVIGYYLDNATEVETYVQGRQAAGDSARRAAEGRHAPIGVRSRLLSRRR